ncbi:MAG: tetratricopeptide repeat protein [Bacteroidetes bacterium]|nr:tetratricopeptide repeat protein [Bacteroidota bacterium]
MNEKYKYLLMIDRYLVGEMDSAEARAFELELQSNKELIQELAFERDLSDLLKQQNIIEFRQKLSDAISESKQKKYRNRIIPLTRKSYALMAASVTILIMIAASVYLLMPKTYSNSRLFSMYYDSDKLNITRSEGTYLVEALRLYQQKDFPTAIDLFNDVIADDPNNAAVRFYLAISFIETNQVDKAIINLEEIINNGKNLYVEHAQWYLGLCLLKINQTDQAIELFRNMAYDTNNYYRNDASRLLNQIKKSK